MKTYKGLIIPTGTDKKYAAMLIKKYGIEGVTCEAVFHGSHDATRCKGISCEVCLLFNSTDKSRTKFLEWTSQINNWIPKNGDRVWCLVITDKVTYYDDIYNEKTHKVVFDNGLIFRTREQVRRIVNEIKNIL